MCLRRYVPFPHKRMLRVVFMICAFDIHGRDDGVIWLSRKTLKTQRFYINSYSIFVCMAATCLFHTHAGMPYMVSVYAAIISFYEAHKFFLSVPLFSVYLSNIPLHLSFSVPFVSISASHSLSKRTRLECPICILIEVKIGRQKDDENTSKNVCHVDYVVRTLFYLQTSESIFSISMLSAHIHIYCDLHRLNAVESRQT